ncbi:MAG: hypothetical protein SFZ23_10780 [Planctomycetota bacterium]|nr:hypothetical protein [Planctomycetota bacterium]
MSILASVVGLSTVGVAVCIASAATVSGALEAGLPAPVAVDVPGLGVLALKPEFLSSAQIERALREFSSRSGSRDLARAEVGDAVIPGPAPVQAACLDCPQTRTAGVSYHAIAIRDNGVVRAWGTNTSGQTVVPANLSGVVHVIAGRQHSYVLRGDGTLLGWGDNFYGQINTPAGLGTVCAVTGSFDHTVARLSDRSIRLWGCESCPFDFGIDDIPPGVANVAQFDAEGPATIVLRGDGRVILWGDQTPPNWPWPPITCGQSNVPATPTDVVQVATGTLHGLALRRDGTVVGWGAQCPESNYGQANVPAELRNPVTANVVKITAGAQHSLALRADGTVVAWGLNNQGQTTVPSGLDDVVFIDARNFLSLAVRRNGQIVIWGDTLANGVLPVPAGAYRTSGCAACRADTDGNGQVDFFDYLRFAEDFAADRPAADFNSDGDVDFFDYLDFAAEFATACE